MSQIDLSHVARSLRLSSTFDVIRRQQIVNEYGEVTINQNTIKDVYGVVTSGGNNQLDRGEDAETMLKRISVVTPFRLRGPSLSTPAGPSWLPDIILWQSNHFLIDTLDDYGSQYGEGFVQAEALSIDFVDNPTSGPQGRFDFSDPANSGELTCF